MVRKTVVKRKQASKAQGNRKFSIAIVHRLGPYASQQEALQAKASIKRSVSHSQFSTLKMTGRGIVFDTRTSYIKSLPAVLKTSEIAAHLKAQSPGAKVAVKAVA